MVGISLKRYIISLTLAVGLKIDVTMVRYIAIEFKITNCQLHLPLPSKVDDIRLLCLTCSRV